MLVMLVMLVMLAMLVMYHSDQNLLYRQFVGLKYWCCCSNAC